MKTMPTSGPDGVPENELAGMPETESAGMATLIVLGVVFFCQRVARPITEKYVNMIYLSEIAAQINDCDVTLPCFSMKFKMFTVLCVLDCAQCPE